jgi:hypothetical protein
VRPVEPGADLGGDMRAKPRAARLCQPVLLGEGPRTRLLPGDLYLAKPWRGDGVAHRLIEAVYAFADGFGTASVYWLTQEYNAPAPLPLRHPRPSDILRRLPALSLPEDSGRYGRRRRLPWANPLRYAQADRRVRLLARGPLVHAEVRASMAESWSQPDQDQQRSDQQADTEWLR